MINMKTKIKIALMVAFTAVMLTGCTAACEREMKSDYSNWSGGLERTVNIYSYDGDLIRTVEGKIDVEVSEGGKVLFDLDGKRYIYYGCMVEIIEK